MSNGNKMFWFCVVVACAYGVMNNRGFPQVMSIVGLMYSFNILGQGVKA